MHNFDRDFQRMSRRHNTMFRVVSSFIGVVWVLLILAFVAVGAIVFNVSGEIGDRGLKAVLTDLWEGPQEK